VLLQRDVICEPAGEAHTLVVTNDSPEPALIFFCAEGGLIYLDKAVDGGFGAYEDGFTILEFCPKHDREAGWMHARRTCSFADRDTRFSDGSMDGLAGIPACIGTSCA
jgi:hypothetical protein